MHKTLSLFLQNQHPRWRTFANVSPLLLSLSKRKNHAMTFTSDAHTPAGGGRVPQNPLQDMKQTAQTKHLCDANGFRLANIHWTFVISCCSKFDEAPNTRTLNFQRISKDGIDFVCKKKSDSIFDHKRPVSFIYTEGQYKPGHHVIQWRGDGFCEKIDLDQVLEHVPEYSITEIVASCRARRDIQNMSDRMSIEGVKSKVTELVQQTRAEYENSELSFDELNRCIQAWRFVPDEMEKMTGGPGEIMWDRWEFTREEGTMNWCEPRHLMPY